MDNLGSILFVLPSKAVGGAEIKFFNIIKSLPHVKSVLLTQHDVAEYFSAPGAKTYTFEEFGCHDPIPFSFTKMRRYAKAIARVARFEGTDCIVGIMHTGSFYVSVAKDIFRLRSPDVGTIEGNVSAYFRSEEREPSLIEKCLLRYLLRRPDVIVVPSAGVRDDLMEHFNVPVEKIAVVHNGIDSAGVRELASRPATAPPGPKGKIILTACRLNRQKDFVTLLKAFRKVLDTTEARLIIVGDGELREEILNHAKSLDVERFTTITGFRENPFPLIKSADVFVLSSHFEGFGNVIIEAMALGVPVVATDCPSGPAEIIQHGINGLLVPVKDHEKMAAAVLQLLTDDKTKNKLSANGLERVHSFAMKTMVDNFSSLISNLSVGRKP